MYSVGLVHGRFQPFHNGHKHLVDIMVRECELPVVIIGSIQLYDANNFLSKEEREVILKQIYGDKVTIGFCRDIAKDSPYWDCYLASIVYSLVGKFPEVVYAGPDYGVKWSHVPVKVRREVARVEGISGTQIRRLLREGGDVSNFVPPETLKLIFDKNRPNCFQYRQG
ncbi:nicotinamide-nucleotide adenylyltransferase [Moorella thermoacetica]|uniref:Nicotinamide-nucleotide adenylyltransferase n=1 Tax=Neomoorella thermoacetica TaxID=1525 RepID=A0A1J5P7F3_NEOTH|nr:nicotinamide-nucleotide adenylyltransferase [Moorella thermoacetica]